MEQVLGDEIFARLRSYKKKEKDHTSKTQRTYQKITQDCVDENEAEGCHSSCKSRPSRALLCEVVQALPYPHASKPPSICLLPAAFTPSNINMLVLCYGTLFTRQKHQPNICKEAGIGGYKTNHSLCATAATRLYQSEVDEQLVMVRTKQRSLEGVHSYIQKNLRYTVPSTF